MPTGAGKSITVISFIAKYKQFYKFVLIVRTRGLVFQLEKDLKTYGLEYSIYMHGQKIDLTKSIILCSKDTLDSRDFLPFEGEDNVVCVVDEADEYKEYQKEIIERYSSKSKRFFYMGMTATAYNNLDQFDVALTPITAKELNQQKILVDYDYVVPDVDLDMSDVEIIDGSWKQSDIIKKMDHPKMIAACFNAWLEHGDNRQTLIFCINKEHSKNVTKYINNYYGKEVAIHCDADTPEEDRKKAIEKFKNGSIRHLSNIRLFTRGTNIIEIGCILDAANTLSLNHHIQKIGRGSRKNPMYTDCILIDCVGNLGNNGGFYVDREIDLTSNYKKTKSTLEVQQIRVCGKCFRASEPEDFGKKNICPFCRYSNKPIKKKKLSKYMKDKLFMTHATEEQIEQKQIINEFKKTLWKREHLGKRYQKDIAKELALMDLLKKHGVEKVLKVQKSVGLTQKAIDKYNRQYKYIPLGGLDL